MSAAWAEASAFSLVRLSSSTRRRSASADNKGAEATTAAVGTASAGVAGVAAAAEAAVATAVVGAAADAADAAGAADMIWPIAAALAGAGCGAAATAWGGRCPLRDAAFGSR